MTITEIITIYTYIMVWIWIFHFIDIKTAPKKAISKIFTISKNGEITFYGSVRILNKGDVNDTFNII